MAKTDLKVRGIRDVVPALRTTEGGGVSIRRAFPTSRIEDLDPFLLLDHMGPIEFAPGQSTGFPDHPHRGFETVSYILRGVLEHRDSFGNHGVIGPGDVQWMTAGSGLVHSEMPGKELVRNGGVLEGFQIWVNLPKRAKMAAPHYQELKADMIPVGRDRGAQARVIAGDALGVRGAVQTESPITYVHFTLPPGASVTQKLPLNQNAAAYVFKGEAVIGGQTVGEAKIAILDRDGEVAEISNHGSTPMDLLFLAGEPLGEPVARYGPFVMNTRDELVQAFEDYRAGKMGTLE